MIKEKLNQEFKEAMKGKNMPVLSILRVLKSEIQRAEQSQSGKKELVDNEIFFIIKKMIQGIIETTNNEIEINTLLNYLPKQLSEHEISDIISGIEDKSIPNVMKFFKENYNGQYDGKVINNILKN